MRLFVLCLAIGALSAGEAPLPASSQKLIDDSVAAATKLRDTFQQAIGKEQGKLVAALQKEQEKFTKKGDLDGAIAVKAAIEQVQGGLLERKVEESKDLLGDGPKTTSNKAAPAELVPAGLTTNCPIAPSGPNTEEAPAQFAQFMTRASMLTLPKGDAVRYQFTCRNPGAVIICTGPSERAHAELWQTLQQAGFKRIENPERHAWFVLEAAAGTQFTVYDAPLASLNVAIYAGQIRQVR